MTMDFNRLDNLVRGDPLANERQDGHVQDRGLRHSSSQALISCNPLVGVNLAARRATLNAANQGSFVSNTGGEMNSSIHFTMEDNSAENDLAALS